MTEKFRWRMGILLIAACVLFAATAIPIWIYVSQVLAVLQAAAWLAMGISIIRQMRAYYGE
jgi:hypothetical protein